MNKTVSETEEFIQRLIAIKCPKNVEAVICPPFTSIKEAKKMIANTNIKLGAQNMYYEENGAFTGEVSPVMLSDLGVDYVIVGHSERRQIFQEDDLLINKKIHAAYKYGLTPILCVGESLNEKVAGQTEQVVSNQVKLGIEWLTAEQTAKLVIAYEPIWAIGTGKSCDALEANRTIAVIRQKVKDIYGEQTAAAVRIQYGGSVKPDNITSYMEQPEIDGALVGGASMQADSFSQLLNCRAEKQQDSNIEQEVFPRPVALVILDGFGLREQETANAIKLANTPVFDKLSAECPCASLGASGRFVGLPDGQMGNSEVGHLNIGAGRIVYQELTRIDKAIVDRDFFNNKALLEAVNNAKNNNKKLHLFGLLSDGGVHSHITHLYALLELAKKQGITDVYVHAFMDGRDTAPDAGIQYIEQLLEKFTELGIGKLATIQGRYYAMDRDKRWDRVALAYNTIVNGIAPLQKDALLLMQEAYARQVYDEFIEPVVVDDGGLVQAGDSVIFFNFRPDRALQLSRAFTELEFNEFDRGLNPPQTIYVTMTEYSTELTARVAFCTLNLVNTLGEVLQKNGKTQLRIAETEKYRHVTSFFSGGREQEYDGETRIMINSPKVATYDLQPEMSAYEMTNKLAQLIASKRFDCIIINYANADMVGHTGNLNAAITAIETVDKCLGQLIAAIDSVGGVAIITADHGNADMMQYPDGSRHTAHTLNRVPLIISSSAICQGATASPLLQLRQDGILADLAPTVLDLLGLPIPSEMTGKSLMVESGKINN